MTRASLVAAVLAAASGAATAAPPAYAQAAAPAAAAATPKWVLQDYFRAYNNHDLDALAAAVGPDFEWISVASEGTRAEVRGAAALRHWLEGYFRDLPSARSEFEILAINGPWASVREKAMFDTASGPREQTALSVYEIRSGRIHRVWYYPAVR